MIDKKAREQLVYNRFLDARPFFAGRRITKIVPLDERAGEGLDPVPDILCSDATRRRIGVELGEWLSTEQMAADIARDRLEATYFDAIEQIPKPPHIGVVRLFARIRLTNDRVPAFSAEFRAYLWSLESDWSEHRERRSRQGFRCDNFSGYPCLAEHLEELRIEAAEFYVPPDGLPWIWFPARGGAFTPQWAVQALVALLNDKCGKYTTLKQDKGLDALYLVAYYEQAFRRNTPYVPLTLAHVAARARMLAIGCPGPFDAIYVLDVMQQPEKVVQLWP